MDFHLRCKRQIVVSIDQRVGSQDSHEVAFPIRKKLPPNRIEGFEALQEIPKV